jgi:hypothetical protein
MVAWLLVSMITTEACGLLVSRSPILPGSRKQASATLTRAYVLQPGGGPIDVRRLKYENTRVTR